MDTDKTNSEEKAKDPEMNVTQTYHGTFAITFIDYMAAEYLDEYDNPDTPQYQVLEQNITNMLHETYVSVDQFVEFLYSELLDVRNGSIIVDFMLVFKIKRKNYQLSIVELKQVLHHTIIVGDTVFQIDTDSIVITEHITTLPPTTVESTVLPVTITFPPPPPPPPPPPFTTRAPPSTITTMQTETSVMTTMRPSTPGRTARVTTQPPTTKTTTESTSM
uniref:Mucin-2-like n=1 Tax=Saccoglossus kowalevskii TaxID=10224 RepID=A0ABM0LYP9_SACKO|nr:PREDICTED: mucin-2-like [Saccoglossus kowalevskii]